MFGKGDRMVMLAAFLSFLFSVALWFGIGMSANKDAGIFVGIWVPSIISAGTYIHRGSEGHQVNEAPVFFFGFLVFLLVGAGFALTIHELSKMGNRDQDDSYPRSRPDSTQSLK